jgi:hypothetical protein
MGWRDCWSTFTGKRGQRVGFGHELMLASTSKPGNSERPQHRALLPKSNYVLRSS